MRWPWSKPKRPEIPPFRPQLREVHAELCARDTIARPKPDPGILVEEIDTSAMTSTGVHKAWDRLKGAK